MVAIAPLTAGVGDAPRLDDDIDRDLDQIHRTSWFKARLNVDQEAVRIRSDACIQYVAEKRCNMRRAGARKTPRMRQSVCPVRALYMLGDDERPVGLRMMSALTLVAEDMACGACRTVDMTNRTITQSICERVVLFVCNVAACLSQELQGLVDATSMVGVIIQRRMITDVFAIIERRLFDVIDRGINLAHGFLLVRRLRPISRPMFDQPPCGTQIRQRVQVGGMALGRGCYYDTWRWWRRWRWRWRGHAPCQGREGNHTKQREIQFERVRHESLQYSSHGFA
jgi:hypothetical protein